MARIPESEIERLKSEVAIERLVEGSGVVLKKSGKDKLGRCPFHEDETASLVVTPAKNLWHCFGCGIGGGPIDWVMKRNGVSFRHAVELLRADSSLAAVAAGGEPVKPVGRSRSARLPAPVVMDASEQELLNQVMGYYQETLASSPEALAYLERRGLGGQAGRDLIEAHRLGFANRTLGYRLPAARVKAGAELRGRLQALGVLRQSGHEHFNGCLVVPVFDEAGNAVEVYGRKIGDGADAPLHLYLPGPHRGAWNAQGLVGQAEVILCEALIDAMTFWCAGHRNVTAAYGVEGLTDDHLAIFKRCGVQRVLIAYDRDEAGDRGAAKAAQRLMEAGMACYRLQFPKGMDANSYALKVTPAAKSLGLLIRKAVWLGQGEPPAEGPGQHVENAPLPGEAPEPSSLAASSPVVPVAPAASARADIEAEVNGDEVSVTLGDRRWRVRGLAKNLGPEALKVNVLVSRGEAFHVDTFDLYAARARAAYIAQAAKELAVKDETVKLDLGRLLLKLETVQAERIQAAMKVEPAAPKMSEQEEAEAMALLKSPDLMGRILADFDACGLVGEGTNKLVAYLAAVSRKLAGPLAIVVQSSSAAGKSSLMDAVLAFMPEEERIKYSAMTGQSLFYMGETNLKHKILAICEEEGASRASYALKLLQSDGELTIASTGKDATTGNLVTQQYRVEGPVMIFLTTTAIEIDEELLNRCLVLTVDEGREQTEAIHRLQRLKRTLEGLKAKQDKARLIRLHQNAQRLLRPLAVVNPYADRLTFLSDKTRTRRDHEKYLTLIDAIALLHQHQRPIKTMVDGDRAIEYIEVTMGDIDQANRLAHEVLGRSLDELPPQTRRLLASLVALVGQRMQALACERGEVRLTRKDVRDFCGWGDTQLKVHLARLVELEYLLAHRADRGQGFAYELLFDGDVAAGVHLSGLIDSNGLDGCNYDAQRSGVKAERSAPGRGAVGQQSAVGRTASIEQSPVLTGLVGDEAAEDEETPVLKVNGHHRPNVPASLALAASAVVEVQR